MLHSQVWVSNPVPVPLVAKRATIPEYPVVENLKTTLFPLPFLQQEKVAGQLMSFL